MRANQYSRDHGLRQFVVYQGKRNAAMRDFEREIIPMCHDEGMRLYPYSTLGSGQFQTEEVYKEREKHNPGRNAIPTSQRYKQVSKVLEDVAKVKESSIAGVALAYILNKEPCVFPLIGGRKVEHLTGNIAALRSALSDDDVKKIETAYEFDHGFPHTFLNGSLLNQSTSKQVKGPEDVRLTMTLGKFDFVDCLNPIGPAKVTP